MLAAFLLVWIGAVACAAAGCTVPAVFLGVVMLTLIFRWELDRLERHFSDRRRDGGLSTG